MPGNYIVANGETITVAPLLTTTYTLTVTNANNVSVTQDRIIDVVQPISITPTLDVQPGSVNRGDTFQVQYLVPIAASVTVVMTHTWAGLVFENPADFTVVSSSEDTTSVPGGKQVTINYDLTIGTQLAFRNRYGYDFVWLDISIQGPGISISRILFIEGNP
jgi:hypothetical protein